MRKEDEIRSLLDWLTEAAFEFLRYESYSSFVILHDARRKYTPLNRLRGAPQARHRFNQIISGGRKVIALQNVGIGETNTYHILSC